MTLISKIKKNSRVIYLSLLFVASCTIAIFSFPLQGKFKYEYQKGAPWQHETLIAPFNFPIYKTELELKNERDSLLSNFSPYFKYEKKVAEANIARFKNEYSTNFEAALKIVRTEYNGIRRRDTLKAFCENKSIEILNFIYGKGVVDYNDLLANAGSNPTIMVMFDNIAKISNVDEVFTQKLAYKYISSFLSEKYPEQPFLVALIENLKLYNYVEKNLIFDQSITLRFQNQLIAQISQTEGMIQAGELIVSMGQLIKNDNYKVLESLRKEYESFLGSDTNNRWIFTGQVLLVIICFGTLFLFMYNFRKVILDSFLKSLFVFMMVILMVISTSIVSRLGNISLYVIPFAAVPIIIHAFYDARLAFFIHLITVVLCGFWAPNGFEFVFLNVVAGAVAIFTLAQMYRRGQLFLTVGLIVLSYSLSYFAVALMQEGDLSKINVNNFMWFAANGALLLVSYPFIFVFEKIFGFLSEVTLLELSDTNHPALRALAEKAPGTFQHVMQVANLAEEVARRIGANPLLTRVGTLYHDIGKTGAPSFFVENQSGVNPHDGITYDKSAEMIIQHVHHGVALARKYKLPQPIVDFIVTHHGKGVVKYFYTKYANENNGVVPDISKFSYPGPSPFTKETAILMMADAIEAASRTLKEYNEETIGNLVEKIVAAQIADNQFADADITYRDVTIAKEVFKEKIMRIYHSRIEYPDLKEPEEK